MALLALHAISRWDTVGCFAGKGKLTFFRGLQNTKDDAIIAALVNFCVTPNLDKIDVEDIAQFVSVVYTHYEIQDGTFSQRNCRRRETSTYTFGI